MRRIGVVGLILASGLAGLGGASRSLAAEDTAGRPVTFAGRTWQVKVGQGLGPGPNRWSGGRDCVRVDDAGSLHLAIIPSDDSWACSEVSLPRSLGHGEYRWVLAGDLSSLDPRSVLGLFLYEDDQHEVDFELSRWGKTDSPNAQFVMQPTSKDSIHRFETGKADRLTVRMTWTPAEVRFRCWDGEDSAQPPLAEWTYAGPKVPLPGKERVIMNFWLKDGKTSPGTGRQAVVVRSFDFKPAGTRSP